MQKEKRILLVLLWANGDCLYGTTIAQQIKHDHPGCHLTWAIAGFCKNIIDNNPFVDAVIEINDAPKNDIPAFRRYKRKVLQQKKDGTWDDVIIPQLVDDNLANYDGCIRSAIFRGYPGKITVPVTPILRLSVDEKKVVADFAKNNGLPGYKNVILFEFAPLSKQSGITMEKAFEIAKEITGRTNSVVILSSGKRLDIKTENVVDGSVLSLRETAELTHYCNFLIGSSSGITWISTSDAAKKLPMVQLLDTRSLFLNSVARDLERQGFDDSRIIELTDGAISNTAECVIAALTDLDNARKQYHHKIPVSFFTTRSIVYNLLCHLQFRAIIKHVKVNREVYGDNILFYKEFILGILNFPFRLIKNLVTKHFSSL